MLKCNTETVLINNSLPGPLTPSSFPGIVPVIAFVGTMPMKHICI